MAEEADRPRIPSKPVVLEVNSAELLRGQTELLIRHCEELYRLKLTRNGNLVLQK